MIIHSGLGIKEEGTLRLEGLSSGQVKKLSEMLQPKNSGISEDNSRSSSKGEEAYSFYKKIGKQVRNWYLPKV